MKSEATIIICGQSVKMRYCAAAETGYESLSGNSISVFTPTFGKDDDGNDIVKEPAKATMGDFLTLAIASIVAAYAKDGKDAPISSEDILYDATPEEITLLITTVVALRAEWYHVPSVIGKEMEEKTEDSDPKNA